jgi:diguanylate cyclase (GGDEF)-like protein
VAGKRNRAISALQQWFGGSSAIVRSGRFRKRKARRLQAGTIQGNRTLNQPPEPSRTVQLFRRTFRWTTDLDRPRAAMTVAGMFAAVAALDALTGSTVSMMAGYLFVICVTAWTLREKVGFAMIAVAVGTMSVINGFGSAAPVEGLSLGAGPALWNLASRALTAVLIVMLISTLRQALEMERWRASTDSLTGALNRDAFAAQFRRLTRRAQSSGATLLLAYMDLDGFKAVNDSCGHAAGDAVLQAFAREVSGRLRGDDLFARIGGDEFAALLLIDSDIAPESLAEILHTRISEALRSTGYRVTCSMGAVILHEVAEDAHEQLIAYADALMYEVKASSKNALRIAMPDGPAPRPRPSPARRPMRAAA